MAMIVSLQSEKICIEVSHLSDIIKSRQMVKDISRRIGFEEQIQDELVLVASELASNIVKYAKFGKLIITPLIEDSKKGIQIESLDKGIGINNVEESLKDGYSTSNSLGYGLGTVNRIMDELIILPNENGIGTRIICKLWIQEKKNPIYSCPLEFGVASRPYGLFKQNGDAFIIKQMNEEVLIGVIDGLGHGPLAHIAAQEARNYVEKHHNQPLKSIFQGTNVACNKTRGVVMTLVRIDWIKRKMQFAGIGNILGRIVGSETSLNIMARRGIIGNHAPSPLISEIDWNKSFILILHSDGVSKEWFQAEINYHNPATDLAIMILKKYAKDDDDATIVVVKEGKKSDQII